MLIKLEPNSARLLTDMPKIVDHELRKTEITRAVIRSIGKLGLANITIRGISKEGGFSSGTLAHYFNSKEELIDFAFDEISKQAFIRTENRVLDYTTAQQKIRVVIEELTPQLSDEHDAVISVSFWAAARQDEKLRRKFHDVYDNLRGHLRDYIGEGIGSGEFEIHGQIEDEIDFIVAVTDGLLVSFLLDPARFPAHRREWLVTAAMSRLQAGSTRRKEL
ncbi:TetR/AcrR family transcriptional regulator [Pseudomonas syringae]|uniref:TetR/AcrR family transcriptional regulator n=1 Tax=Pseudomonas syringae TaxID=317 RepID=UPI001F0DBE17|nr:TetR/AcrR family transcriptional regulator [Pseudomonas syringae]MCH5520371.1 TetR/AcrR family transcriptional regulator [Pseudomonas syringae pv. lapsa]